MFNVGDKVVMNTDCTDTSGSYHNLIKLGIDTVHEVIGIKGSIIYTDKLGIAGAYDFRFKKYEEKVMFREGDKIRRIAGDNEGEMVKGRVYTFLEYATHGNVKVEGSNSGWDAENFELVEKKFQVGDTVRVVALESSDSKSYNGCYGTVKEIFAIDITENSAKVLINDTLIAFVYTKELVFVSEQKQEMPAMKYYYEEDFYKFLTDSKVKLSKMQMFRFKALVESESFPILETEFKTTKAYNYVNSFKGSPNHISGFPRFYKLNKYALVNQLQPFKLEFKNRFKMRNNHSPVLKNLRYFGIEMECLVKSENYSDECSHCCGSGNDNYECDHCDGTGQEQRLCQECSGEGCLTNEENVNETCQECSGEGTITQDCTYRHCANGEIESECEHCDGSGQNPDSDSSEVINEVIEELRMLNIPYITVTEDGSIENEGNYRGVEVKLMVTMDTLSNIDKVTKLLKDKFDATVNRSCGLHIHLDARHIAKDQHREEYEKVAYRIEKAMKLLRWTVPSHRRGDNAYNKPGMSFSDRYREINATNVETIEIRNHEATLDAKEIKNWIKLMYKCFNCTELDSLELSYDLAAQRCLATLNALNLKPGLKRYVLSRLKVNGESYTKRIIAGLNKLSLTKELKRKIKTIEYRLGA